MQVEDFTIKLKKYLAGDLECCLFSKGFIENFRESNESVAMYIRDVFTSYIQLPISKASLNVLCSDLMKNQLTKFQVSSICLFICTSYVYAIPKGWDMLEDHVMRDILFFMSDQKNLEKDKIENIIEWLRKPSFKLDLS